MADSDESLQKVFDDPTYEDALMETGYRKPLSLLGIEDRPLIRKTLLNYMFLRVKPELDQFREGLGVCGIAGAVRSHLDLMVRHFVHTPIKLNRGMKIAWVSPTLVIELAGGMCVTLQPSVRHFIIVIKVLPKPLQLVPRVVGLG